MRADFEIKTPSKTAHFLVSNPYSPKLLKINTLYINSTLSRGNKLQFRKSHHLRPGALSHPEEAEKPTFKQRPLNLQQNFPE